MEERIEKLLNNAECRLEKYYQAYNKMRDAKDNFSKALEELEGQFRFVGFYNEEDPKFEVYGHTVCLFWRFSFIKNWREYVEDGNVIKKNRLVKSPDLPWRLSEIGVK